MYNYALFVHNTEMVKKQLHPLYSTWSSMKSRCSNKNSPCYKHYGGRGIFVCDRWLSFKDYAHDIESVLGVKPSAKHSIDRVDNDKGYEISNVRWATQTEQVGNRRASISNLLTFNGEKKSATAWCNQFSISTSVFYNRRKVLGWGLEKSLTTPVRLNYISKLRMAKKS